MSEVDIKSEVMWVVYKPSIGFVYGTNSKNAKEAKERFTEGTTITWKNCYNRGYRAVKVIISLVKG